MVNESIEKYGEKEEFKTRKIFYLLLKCELNRDTDNVSEDRKIAKIFVLLQKVLKAYKFAIIKFK